MSLENVFYVSIQEPYKFGCLALFLPQLIKDRFGYEEVDAVGVGSTLVEARLILASLTHDSRRKTITCGKPHLKYRYDDFD